MPVPFSLCAASCMCGCSACMAQGKNPASRPDVSLSKTGLIVFNVYVFLGGGFMVSRMGSKLTPVSERTLLCESSPSELRWPSFLPPLLSPNASLNLYLYPSGQKVPTRLPPQWLPPPPAADPSLLVLEKASHSALSAVFLLIKSGFKLLSKLLCLLLINVFVFCA